MSGTLLLLSINILIICIESSPQLPIHTMQVFGNASMGYYYVNLYIGRPVQTQSVIIDTGSGILTTPCSKCESCGKGHINQYFEVQKSVSSKFLTCSSDVSVCTKSCGNGKQGSKPCQFSISYAEGSSLNGVYLEDYVQLQNGGPSEGVKAHFGCTTRQTNLFLKQEANGIFGLAPDRSDLLEQIFREHSGITGEKLQFSICLSSNGGFLTVGGSNHAFHTEEPIQTSYNKRLNLYSLQKVGSVRVGSKVFHQPQDNPGPYGIFIDCGSTFTYFPRKQFLAFQSEIQSRCSKHTECELVGMVDSMHCYRLTPQNTSESKIIEDLQNLVGKIFPPIEMEVNGKVLSWPSTEYFALRSRENREVCLGISELDRFLLGANWMVNKDVLFNNEQNVIKIYPNSQCVNSSPMILKQEVAQKPKLSPISTSDSHDDSATLLLTEFGIVFFIIAILILAYLISQNQKKKNLSLRKPQQYSLNTVVNQQDIHHQHDLEEDDILRVSNQLQLPDRNSSH